MILTTIIILLSITSIISLFSIFKTNSYHKKVISELIFEVETLSSFVKKNTGEIKNLKQLIEMNLQLTDILHSDVSDHIIKKIYLHVRNLSFDEFPKSPNDFTKILRTISDENYKDAHMNFLTKIKESESFEEKRFYENKLSKLQEIKNLSDTFDESSSDEYVEMIMQEVKKTITELNEESE